MKTLTKLWLGLAILVAVILAAGFLAWSIQKERQNGESGNNSELSKDAVFCPMDAKLCPDGSYVSRTGPNCEFAPCPSQASCEGESCPLEDICEGDMCPGEIETDASELDPGAIENWETYRNEEYKYEL